jgi:hypothetical protein
MQEMSKAQREMQRKQMQQEIFRQLLHTTQRNVESNVE